MTKSRNAACEKTPTSCGGSRRPLAGATLLLCVCVLNGIPSGCDQPAKTVDRSDEIRQDVSAADRLVYLLHRGRFSEAEEAARRNGAPDTSGTASARANAGEIDTLVARAALLERHQDWEESDALLRLADDKMRTASGDNARKRFSLLLHRVRVLKKLGEIEEADACLSRASALAEGMKDSGARLRTRALREKEALLRESGDYEKALREAVRQYEDLLGPNHPYVARGLYHLALLMEENGRKDEAEGYYIRSMKIHEKLLGPKHPVISTFLTHLATLLRKNGEFERAKTYLTKMTDIYEKTLYETEPERLQALKTMVQRTQVDVLPVVNDLIRFEEKQVGLDHPDLAVSLRYYATLLQSNGEDAEAETLIRRALRILAKSYPPQHPEVILTRKRLASCLFSQGKAEEAAVLTEETLALEQKVYGERESAWMPTLYGLAEHLHGVGRYLEAEQAYRRVLDYTLNRKDVDEGFSEQILNKLVQVCLEQGKERDVEILREKLRERGRPETVAERKTFRSCPRGKVMTPTDS